MSVLDLLISKSPPAFTEKPAAFYTKARLLFKIAGGLLKITTRAFLKSRRAFVYYFFFSY
jgi:hypothetical protein